MEKEQTSMPDIQTRIITRAATDANFRKNLLDKGRATIEKELEIKLPPDLEIQVMEETPNRLCLVIPMKQEAKKKLSDAELKGVAGGALPIPIPDPNLISPISTLPEPIPTPEYSFTRLRTYTIKP